MKSVAFDTLSYSANLKKAGMEPNLAEVQAKMNAEIITNILEDNLATKQDIAKIKEDTKQNIYELRCTIKDLETSLSTKILESFWKTIMILGSMQALFLGIFGVIQRLH